MAVQLNHTIVSAHDKQVSAEFLAEILGLSTPAPFGPFMMVQADNEVTLDFMALPAPMWVILVIFRGVGAARWVRRRA